MKIDTMRRVDYFAGIPLCFIASLWVQLTGWFGRAVSGKPARVLFVELSEMGSAILVDPAMRRIQQDTGCELYFVIFRSNAVSLRLLATVPEKNVFTIRDGGLLTLVVDSLRYLWWTRQQGIDTVIDLELFSRYSALLTGLSGASRRVGFHPFHNEGLYRGAMLTHRVAYNPHQHIAKNFVALVNATLSSRPELPYSKRHVSDEEIILARAPEDPDNQARVKARIVAEYPDYDEARQRIVLINPNASDLLPQRRWMPASFVAVMQGLLADYDDLLILITGAPAERAEAAVLKQQVDSDRCINFAGRLQLEEMVPLYQLADLMLTNDSGPAHFSAVTGLRCFVIFGPETPHLYGSLGNASAIYAGLACSPCVSASNHRKTPCTDNVCLQVISVAQVLQELRSELDGGALA